MCIYISDVEANMPRNRLKNPHIYFFTSIAYKSNLLTKLLKDQIQQCKRLTFSSYFINLKHCLNIKDVEYYVVSIFTNFLTIIKIHRVLCLLMFLIN